jgi:hypothetical protein
LNRNFLNVIGSTKPRQFPELSTLQDKEASSEMFPEKGCRLKWKAHEFGLNPSEYISHFSTHKPKLIRTGETDTTEFNIFDENREQQKSADK